MRIVVPLSLAEANRYVDAFHRHNGRLPSAKFAVGVIDNSGRLMGVAIAGLPKARMLLDGGTLEVNRVCTDGSRNACSMLYGACIRAARALGYWRAVTYTLESEAGASLRASGWTLVAESRRERSWTRERGTGRTYDNTGLKNRWEIILAERPPRIVWPDALTPDQMDLFGLKDVLRNEGGVPA